MKDFEFFIPFLTTYFLEETVLVSPKVATNHHFWGKKNLPKINIFKVIFKAKAELNYQSNLRFSHAFEIFIPCLTISFSEVTASISLNAATYVSLTVRKTSKMSILKQKWVSATKVIHAFWMTLQGSYLEQLYIFQKCVHTFHRK